MSPLLLVWLQFLGCTAVVGIAGARLVRHADIISARTGLSRSWIGLVLVATATSLPELVTGLSAVTVAHAPDIAVGDALGSCVFNLALVALLDVLSRPGSVFQRAGRLDIASAGIGVALLGLVGLGLLVSGPGQWPAFRHVGLTSVLIVVAYLGAMRMLFRLEPQAPTPAPAPGPAEAGGSLRGALLGYGLSTMAIVGAGVWLSVVGVELAQAMGWSRSFVGATFVAMATSVPELATTLAAARLGAVEMALGNLLGSNLFDVLILAVDDAAYTDGQLLSAVSSSHLGTVLVATAMNGVFVVAAASPPTRRVARLASAPSLMLVAGYVVNALVQFQPH